jgi:hypothetical protein
MRRFCLLLLVALASVAEVQAAGLASLYTLDNTTDNAVSGAPNGTLQAAPNLPYYIPGVIGNAAYFNAAAVGTTTAGFPKSGVPGLPASVWNGSATFWINVPAVGATQQTIMGGYNADKTCWEVSLQPGNTLELFDRGTLASGLGKLQVDQSGGTLAPDGSWHHVAITWNATTGAAGTGHGHIYVDGVPQPAALTSNTIDSSATVFTPWVYPVWIGSGGSPGPDGTLRNASLDDVSVWSGELTATEAKAIYNLGKSGTYNAKDCQSLFTLFAAGPGSSGLVEGSRWSYAGGLVGSPGDMVGGALILDANGHGVQGQVPEPSTLTLLTAALLGLVAYAWRI